MIRSGQGASVLALVIGSLFLWGAGPSAAMSRPRPAKVVELAAVTGAASSSANPALIQEGHTLFEAHCAVCHGSLAQGKIGPRIVGKTEDDINHALATVTLMSSLKNLPVADRAAIAAYLQSLQ